jgi:hypothetical protein
VTGADAFVSGFISGHDVASHLGWAYLSNHASFIMATGGGSGKPIAIAGGMGDRMKAVGDRQFSRLIQSAKR